MRRRKPPWYSYDDVITRNASRAARFEISASTSGVARSPRSPRCPPETTGASPRRSARRPLRRPAGNSRRAALRPRIRRSSSDAGGTPRARAASAGRRGRADRAAARSPRAWALSRTSRNRVSASKARGFRSCSVKSRSIASSPTRPDGQAVRVLASLAVRPHERGPGHGRQLSAPLVEHQLDVAQRLEPPAETRLRPPDPLRDRPHAPALERVQVQDAVRLAEPQRAQDDRLRLVPAPRHASSVGTATVGN